MNRVRLYIKLNDLVRISASLLCIIYIINDKMVLGVPYFDTIQRYIVRVLIVMVLYMIHTKPEMFNKRSVTVFVLFALFSSVTFISAIYNRHTIAATNPVSLVRTDFLLLVCAYITMLYIAACDKFEEFIRILTIYMFSICALIDFFILAGKNFGSTSGGMIYLIGTKFTVSYTHMILIVTYLVFIHTTGKKLNRWIFGYISVFSVIITIIVDCNTGTIGVLILLSIILIHKSFSLKGYNRLSYPVTLFAGVAFIATYTIILSIPVVQMFISDVLERDTTLTGRTDIYARLFYVIIQKPLWGYGYGNSGRISYMYFQYANTQNGLMEWVLQIGILGVASMLIFFMYVISMTRSLDYDKQIYPVFALIITYNCLATVEITISLTYIFFILFMGVWCCREYSIRQKGDTGL